MCQYRFNFWKSRQFLLEQACGPFRAFCKQIFPQLTKKDAYRLLRLISVFVFLIAALGIGAWV